MDFYQAQPQPQEGHHLHHKLQEIVPLGQPTIRQWEITEATTRYERLQAAPSDEDLRIMWILWVIISGGIALFIGVVLLALLLNRKARTNPFNLYLIYLMIPDFLFSGFCGLTCLLNAIAGQYWSVSMCQFQSFYLTFGVAANNWLNLFVARELHKLLRSSKYLHRYQLPSSQTVGRQAIGVYIYSAFVASWALWGRHFKNFPHEVVSISGLGCFPLEYSKASSYFYFLAYIPLVAAIPLIWVIGIGINIWYAKLMPPPGKRRMLSTFFFRIMAAYVIMWMPYLVMCLAGSGYPWLVFAGGSWGHFQGVVSTVIAMTKPDIRHAVRRLLTCQCSAKDPAERQRVSTFASSDNIMTTSSNHRSAIDDYLPNQTSDFHFKDERRSSNNETSHQFEEDVERQHMDAPNNIEEPQQSEEAMVAAAAAAIQAKEGGNAEEDNAVEDYLPEQTSDFIFKDERRISKFQDER